MRDIGPDNPRQRHCRIEQNQRRDAQRAATDRGQRHQNTQRNAGQHGQCWGPLHA